jgi:hypothetical protein
VARRDVLFRPNGAWYHSDRSFVTPILTPSATVR